MLALDAQWLGAVGMGPRSDLRSTIGLAGPYDFLPPGYGPVAGDIRSRAEPLSRSQPINFVDGTRIPHAAAGRHGRTRRSTQATRCGWRRAFRRWAARVEHRLYPGLGHEELVGVDRRAAPLPGPRRCGIACPSWDAARRRGRSPWFGGSALFVAVALGLAMAMGGAWLVQRATRNAGWVDVIWSLATGCGRGWSAPWRSCRASRRSPPVPGSWRAWPPSGRSAWRRTSPPARLGGQKMSATPGFRAGVGGRRSSGGCSCS